MLPHRCRKVRFSSILSIAAVVGVCALAADLALVWWNHPPESMEARGAVGLAALAAYFYLVRGDLESVGLAVRPAQGWRFWFWATLLMGLAVAALIAAGLGIWALLGHELRLPTLPPREVGPALVRMCVFAPILEETIYRVLICVPLAACGRAWLAVAASGTAFAGLHLIYGNPSPENLFGGLFLAWAYLKSGTIGVPVLLHALGNLCVLVGQVAAWHWVGGAA